MLENKNPMDKCMKCGLDLYYQNLCRKCFCNSTEKKVSKEATANLQKNDIILVIDDGSDLARLNWHFLKLFAEKVPCCIAFDDIDSLSNKVKIKDEKITIANKVKKIIPCNMEDEIREFSKSLEGGNLKSFLKSERSDKKIKILRTLSEEECSKYSEARKMKYHMRKEADDLMIMINKIESKYPGRKMGMIKTMQELRNIFKKKEN